MNVVDILELITVIILTILIVTLLMSRKKLILRRITGILVINLLLIGHLSYGVLLEKPVMNLLGDEIVTIEVGGQYQESGATVKFHNRDYTQSIAIENRVDTKKVGQYTVVYTFLFRNESIQRTRIVHIVDTTPPVLTLKGNNIAKVVAGNTYKEEGYTATDVGDGDISSKVTIEKQEKSATEYQLIYKVSDSSGNTATATRTIQIVEPPKQEQAIPNSKGIIYLTFDDGPSLDITPKILDILKEENIKATFFILNYDANREILVKRIVDEGHTIAIHGYSHDYKQIYQSVDAYMNNITKLQDKIYQSTGVKTMYTRFPGGSSNTVSKHYCQGIMSVLTKKIVNEGYRYYDWNVSSGDAGGAKNKEEVYHNVTTGLRKNRANMVLMHDFSKNTKTLEALRDIIHYGKENGYTFDKITDSTPIITQKVAN